VSEKDNFFNKYILNSKSSSYRNMINLCDKVAKSNANVMLIGESGSGKDVTARYIHYKSRRSDMPMVTLNCSSFSDSLLESELFGHVKGAFTGAIDDKKGKIETSRGGTLFLDEIGELSLKTQIKLLRTIENKKVAKVGSNEEREIDFRLITATNVDINEAVCSNKIREDFAYRISTIVIRVPSLKERMEDFDDLLDFMLKKSQKENDIEIKRIEPKVKSFLYSYDYPGNLRELKNIIDRMVVLSEKGVITKQGLPIVHSLGQNYKCGDSKIYPLREYREIKESEYIKKILEKYDYNVPKSSQVLEISDRQLFNLIKKYDLK
jgi:transcriptional regulator with PAS, ATPase and Fis domain